MVELEDSLPNNGLQHFTRFICVCLCVCQRRVYAFKDKYQVGRERPWDGLGHDRTRELWLLQIGLKCAPCLLISLPHFPLTFYLSVVPEYLFLGCVGGCHPYLSPPSQWALSTCSWGVCGGCRLCLSLPSPVYIHHHHYSVNPVNRKSSL